MSKPPRDRASSASQTYFVTTSAWQNQALFQSKRCADLFLTTLFAYRDQSKFLVHEFVLMPNHAHILLTLGSNVTLERAVQFIKGGFSFRAGKDLGSNVKYGNAATSIIASAITRITCIIANTFDKILLKLTWSRLQMSTPITLLGKVSNSIPSLRG